MPSRIKLRPRSTPPPAPEADSETLFLDDAGTLQSIDSEGIVTAVAGGGAAEAGTVVVTPPAEVDIGAALEGANAPSAGNPFVTASENVSAVKFVSRTLTSAEILALETTDIELLAATPGVIHALVAVYAVYRANTTGYFFPGDPGTIGVDAGYDNLVEFSPLLIDSTIEDVYQAKVHPGSLAPSPADASLVGRNIFAYAQPDDPEGGDGELDLTVLYRDVTVS